MNPETLVAKIVDWLLEARLPQEPPHWDMKIVRLANTAGGYIYYSKKEVYVNEMFFDSPKVDMVTAEIYFRELCLSVFHEFRHAYQFVNKMFIPEYTALHKAGVDSRTLPKDKYNVLPWELDAEGYARNVYSRFVNTWEHLALLEAYRAIHFPMEYEI